MTDLLVDITQHLIDKGIAIGDGVDIFQNIQPDSPDTIIVLSEYAGLPQPLMLDCGVRSVQVKVRDFGNEDARNRIWAIYHALYNAEDPILQLPNNRWVLCRPRQAPFKLSVDNSDRCIWCFNMGVTTYNEK